MTTKLYEGALSHKGGTCVNILTFQVHSMVNNLNNASHMIWRGGTMMYRHNLISKDHDPCMHKYSSIKMYSHSYTLGVG